MAGVVKRHSQPLGVQIAYQPSALSHGYSGAGAQTMSPSPAHPTERGQTHDDPASSVLPASTSARPASAPASNGPASLPASTSSGPASSATNASRPASSGIPAPEHPHAK